MATHSPSRRGRHRAALVSWPLYRLLAAAAALPPVIALLTLVQPAVPQHPAPPLEFDGSRAANLAAAFVGAERDSGQACCAAGTGAELTGADWVKRKLHSFDSKPAETPFAAKVPWRSAAVPMSNVIAYRAGRSPQIIAVIAHRDGPSAADAAGTGLLVELAHTMSSIPPERGIVLVSTDGGRTGGQGAAEFAQTWSLAPRIVAAIVLDGVAAPDGTALRVVVRPDTDRGTSPTLYAAAVDALSSFYGRPATTPGVYDQVSGYGIPYTPSEQGTLLSHHIPAVTLTAAGSAAARPLQALSGPQLGHVGTAVANLVAELNSATAVDPGGPPVLFLSGKFVRGWLAQLTVAMLLMPFAVCVLDVVARLRRRRVPIGPGFQALAWRFGAWLVVLVALLVEAHAPGRLMSNAGTAPLPGRTGASTAGIAIAAGAALLFWRFLVRPRLVRVDPVPGADRTAGLAAALVGLLFASVLLTAIDPFALVVVLPAAHLWLWIPVAARGGRGAMLACFLVGFLGPALLLWELAGAQGLGRDAPRVLVAMTASGYLSPAVSVCLTLAAAAAAQVGAIGLGRYARPHPPRL